MSRVIDADTRRTADSSTRLPIDKYERAPTEVGAVLPAIDAERLAHLAGTVREVSIRRGEPTTRRHELDPLVAQILTSDLPIDAYLDRGFQQWLTTVKSED